MIDQHEKFLQQTIYMLTQLLKELSLKKQKNKFWRNATSDDESLRNSKDIYEIREEINNSEVRDLPVYYLGTAFFIPPAIFRRVDLVDDHEDVVVIDSIMEVTEKIIVSANLEQAKYVSGQSSIGGNQSSNGIKDEQQEENGRMTFGKPAI